MLKRRTTFPNTTPHPDATITGPQVAFSRLILLLAMFILFLVAEIIIAVYDLPDKFYSAFVYYINPIVFLLSYDAFLTFSNGESETNFRAAKKNQFIYWGITILAKQLSKKQTCFLYLGLSLIGAIFSIIAFVYFLSGIQLMLKAEQDKERKVLRFFQRLYIIFNLLFVLLTILFVWDALATKWHVPLLSQKTLEIAAIIFAYVFNVALLVYFCRLSKTLPGYQKGFTPFRIKNVLLIAIFALFLFVEILYDTVTQNKLYDVLNNEIADTFGSFCNYNDKLIYPIMPEYTTLDEISDELDSRHTGSTYISISVQEDHLEILDMKLLYYSVIALSADTLTPLEDNAERPLSDQFNFLTYQKKPCIQVCLLTLDDGQSFVSLIPSSYLPKLKASEQDGRIHLPCVSFEEYRLFNIFYDVYHDIDRFNELVIDHNERLIVSSYREARDVYEDLVEDADMVYYDKFISFTFVSTLLFVFLYLFISTRGSEHYSK